MPMRVNHGAAQPSPAGDGHEINLDTLRGQLGQLRDALENARGFFTQRVDVSELQAQVAATGDDTLQAQLDTILAEFAEETVTVHGSGCSATVTRTMDDPDKLGRDQAQRVLADLASAQARAEVLDADGSGTLTAAELQVGADDDCLAQQILEAKPGQPEPETAPAPPARTHTTGCG